MNSIYQERILQHSASPHNFGRLPSATNKILLDNPLCGDVIQMEVEVVDGIVKNAMFTGKGCAISKAAASLLTDEVKNKTISELRKMDKVSMIKMLGIELGPNRLKCALLPLEALQKLVK
ncbi:MAG: iron-sulfur cluster assembly scaffold protein [Candidatus Roizmanbacteria bacterium]|nr:iron-sulfur cluster assembly scaffold protein [Candidatus Roizmanbacteria bacterium]